MAPGPPLRTAASFVQTPLWTDEVPLEDATPAPLPASADVVVVGAGYAGLSAGREVARRGRHALVLDAGPLGFGASSRNGGMVIPELKKGPTAAAAVYGDLGRRMYAAVDEAFDLVEQLCGPGGPIDAGYQRTGQLLLAHHPRAVEGLRTFAADLAEAGDPVRLVPADELGAEVGSGAFAGGLVIERTGGLQPARYHRGLLHLAREAGAELHGQTRVTAVEAQPGGRFRVTTERGVVDAGEVVLLTNAYDAGLLPRLSRRVLPIGSFIIATEPLAPQVAAELIPHRRMLVDTKQLLFYWRLTTGRDGDRLVFGGRQSLAATSVLDAAGFLYRSMLRLHPQLEGVTITNAWGGEVAMTFDRMPHAGVIDGVRYATGCNGSGVALNTWMGRAVGAWACGDPAPAFAELDHPAIPLRALRRLWLPLVGRYVKMQDRRGR
jgi:glycine/D-amino acid oxidase-like deaminating enzyme